MARFRPLVLCYHAVSESWRCGLTLGAREIERQLRSALARGYRPGPAADTLDGTARVLHVTFDDAYRSVAGFVPTLERLGLQATVFACAAYADDGGRVQVPELAEENAANPEETLTMDWDALRGLAERGVEIGSHTLTHPHLTQLGNGELERELQESRERLEDELGRACRFLSYPYGDEDARVHDAAAAAGYEAAFALPGRESPLNRFALPRVGIYRRDTGLRFAVKTSSLGRRLAAA